MTEVEMIDLTKQVQYRCGPIIVLETLKLPKYTGYKDLFEAGYSQKRYIIIPTRVSSSSTAKMHRKFMSANSVEEILDLFRLIDRRYSVVLDADHMFLNNLYAAYANLVMELTKDFDI